MTRAILVPRDEDYVKTMLTHRLICAYVEVPYYCHMPHGLSQLDLNATKPVFGVSDKLRLKTVSSAMETSQNIEIWLETSLDMTLSSKPITKVLNSLRR